MHLAGFQTFGCLINSSLLSTAHTQGLFRKPWLQGWGTGEGFTERCGEGRVKDGDGEFTGVDKSERFHRQTFTMK